MVHLRSILAIARKDAVDIWLDRSKLVALLGPIALTLVWLVLGHLLNPQPNQPNQPTALLVYNPSHSGLEQVISGTFPNPQITVASSPAQVSAAFGASGASPSASYDVGLVIPAGFENILKAGIRPQVSLYVNGSTVSSPQAALLQAAISYYARTVVTPTSPVSLMTATFHPAPTPTASISSFSLGNYYTNIVLPLSLFATLGLLPGLLIEEKEKKTLRMLMVSPASYTDVMVGKVLVVFVYQMALSLFVLALFGAFSGMVVPLVLLYVVSGVILVLSVGLLLGTMLETAGSVGGLGTLVVFTFIIPAIFIPLVPYLSGNAITQIIKIFPTYYVAEGFYNALHNQGSFSSNVLDIGITLGSALLIFAGTAWLLRRQAQVVTVI